jgi:hypothetical protein
LQSDAHAIAKRKQRDYETMPKLFQATTQANATDWRLFRNAIQSDFKKSDFKALLLRYRCIAS